MGITEAMSRSMTEYVCDDCANAKLNKELFCFCRQVGFGTHFFTNHVKNVLLSGMEHTYIWNGWKGSVRDNEDIIMR